MTRIRSALANAGVTVAAIMVSVLLILVIDVVCSQFAWFDLLTDPALRIYSRPFHHVLAPNLCTWSSWGPLRHRICTNSLGFKDVAKREVPLVATKPRVLIMGDSFTEGIGLPWEGSYVGQFAKTHPELDVINGGIASYSPSVYFARIRDLLSRGYHFDHIVVAIDISDIQDESWYRLDDEAGTLIDILDPPMGETLEALETFGKRNFKVSQVVGRFIDNWRTETKTPADPLHSARAVWTFTDWDKLADGYKPIGVAASVDKARLMMDRLYQLTRAYGIPLSVMVYPWESQLRFDTPDSLQVRIWREWCQGKCRYFIDDFPTFFAYKDAHPDNWRRELFLDKDVHFNEAGYGLIARRMGEFAWP